MFFKKTYKQRHVFVNVKASVLPESLIRIARDYFDDARPTHDWDHVERVHNLCMHIGRIEGADLEVLSCAAYLHDIGRGFEERDISVCHARKGAQLAQGLLADMGFEDTFIQKVVHCIATHRFRDGLMPETLEARVLYDADKLDAIGAIGIARAYAYAGEHNQRLVEEFEREHGDDLAVDHTSHSPIKEYKVKLSKIKDRMLTSEGRRIAEKRDAFMSAFLERLRAECEGVI